MDAKLYEYLKKAVIDYIAYDTRYVSLSDKLIMHGITPCLKENIIDEIYGINLPGEYVKSNIYIKMIRLGEMNDKIIYALVSHNGTIVHEVYIIEMYGSCSP